MKKYIAAYGVKEYASTTELIMLITNLILLKFGCETDCILDTTRFIPEKCHSVTVCQKVYFITK